MNQTIVNTGKVIVTIIAIIVIYSSFDTKELYNEQIYFDQISSFQQNQIITIYGTRKEELHAELSIKNLGGTTVKSTPVDFKKINTAAISSEKGYPKDVLASVELSDYEPGIYTINDAYYFVVESSEPSDLTIVVPSLSNACLDTTAGYSLLTENNKKDCAEISLFKPYKMDYFTTQINLLEALIPDSISVNYCTDIDFNSTESIPKSSAYLFYGNCLFATPSMLFNLNSINLEGANYLFVSQYTFNNKVHYNPSNESLRVCGKNKFRKSNKLRAYEETDPVFNQRIFGANYTFGGSPDISVFPKKTTTIPNEFHFNQTELKLFSDYWIGAYDSNKVDYWFEIPVKRKEQLNTGGIFTFKYSSNSGTIYHLSTSSWLDKGNFEIEANRKFLLQVIQDAIFKRVE